MRVSERVGEADVHDDEAGPLHDVGVVERALVSLSLDPSRARLGDSVIFCPFPTHARSAWRLIPRLRIGVRSRRGRLASFTRRSIWCSFRCFDDG